MGGRKRSYNKLSNWGQFGIWSLNSILSLRGWKILELGLERAASSKTRTNNFEESNLLITNMFELKCLLHNTKYQ